MCKLHWFGIVRDEYILGFKSWSALATPVFLRLLMLQKKANPRSNCALRVPSELESPIDVDLSVTFLPDFDRGDFLEKLFNSSSVITALGAMYCVTRRRKCCAMSFPSAPNNNPNEHL